MPDNERWAAIECIVREVLDLPAADRRRAVVERTGDDVALRREVDALLDACDLDDDFLERPAWMFAEASDRVAASTPLPHIEGYRVERELGRGGMAHVVAAVRPDGDRVAIKILSPDHRTPEGLRRFEREVDVLRHLRHRHIAAFVDHGTTIDGAPFVAMEFVDGHPITRYSDERALTVAERLRLFADVTSAVGVAHRDGIVHRDLKPSNILVSSSAEVKLLDFGIARWAHHDAELTRTGARPLTPLYAAPEQIRGEPATPASDVFALGIVLFELLTGRHPFASGSWSIGETERRILDGRFPQPSRLVRRVHEEVRADGTRRKHHPKVVAADRSSSPEAVSKAVAEVEGAIVDALSPNAGDRPANAGRFGRALDQRRSRAATARDEPAARDADAELTLERRRGDALLAFQARLFNLATPTSGGRASMTARDMLDWTAANVDDVLGDEPDAHVDILTTVGRVYVEIGEPRHAIDVLERSLRRREDRYGDTDFRLIDTLRWLGAAYAELQRIDDATSTLERSVALARDAYGDDHLETAARLNDLAIVHSAIGRIETARELYQASLDVGRRHLPDHAPSIVNTLHNQSVMLLRAGYTRQAEHVLWQVHEVRRREQGPDSVYTLNTLHNIMVARRRRGDFDGAEPLAREVIVRRTNVLGERHPDVLTSRFNLASILRDAGNLADADEEFRAARAALSESDADRAVVLAIDMGIAHVRSRTGDRTGAAVRAAAVVDDARVSLGAEHGATINLTLEWARLLVVADDAARAVEPARLAHDDRRRRLGARSPLTLEARLLERVAQLRSGPDNDTRQDLHETSQLLTGEWDTRHPSLVLAADALESSHDGGPVGG